MDPSAGKQGGRSTLFKVLVGLGILVAIPLLLLIGLVAFAAISAGVSGSDDIAIGGDGTSEEIVIAEPTAPEGVTVEWDSAPSSCDGNNKRAFSAWLINGTAEDLEVRMRILDPDNRFVHQSHVYVAPSSDAVQVDLAGIPPGQSTVQLITESDDVAIGQTSVNFEGC